MGDSLEGGDASSTTEQQNVAVVDYTAFANYVLKAASVLMPEDDSQAEPVALRAALDDRANQECIRKFLSDPQVSTLYVQRSSSKGAFFLGGGCDRWTASPVVTLNGLFFLRLSTSCVAAGCFGWEGNGFAMEDHCLAALAKCNFDVDYFAKCINGALTGLIFTYLLFNYTDRCLGSSLRFLEKTTVVIALIYYESKTEEQ